VFVILIPYGIRQLRQWGRDYVSMGVRGILLAQFLLVFLFFLDYDWLSFIIGIILASGIILILFIFQLSKLLKINTHYSNPVKRVEQKKRER
jgi:hypothetical protein